MRFDRALPFTLALTAAGCAAPGPCGDDAAGECLSAASAPRDESPHVPDATLKAVVAGNTAFALDLYQQLRAPVGNLFFAPFSISEALAMTWAGARGDTASQMATTLHFTEAPAAVHPAFDALDLALASRGQGPGGRDAHSVQLTVANGLWGQQGVPFATPFLRTLSQSYGVGIHLTDFKGAPEAARSRINAWVAGRTDGHLADLLAPGSIDPTTQLVLTNAVYFSAAWAKPFDAAETHPAPFTRSDGTTRTVPTMSGYQQAPYVQGQGYAAVALPYAGHQLSMVLILPDALDAFEASLSSDRLAGLLDGLSLHGVSVTLPRFKMSSNLGLADTLSRLGMPAAFTDRADFSGMNGVGRIALSAVAHQALVDVDETGTVAAGATGVVIGPTSVPAPAEIHLDHPFLMVIRDDATGTVLFLGRVEDPAS